MGAIAVRVGAVKVEATVKGFVAVFVLKVKSTLCTPAAHWLLVMNLI